MDIIRASAATALLASACAVALAEPSMDSIDGQLTEIYIWGTGSDAANQGQAVTGEALQAQRLRGGDTARLLEGTPGLSFYSGGGVSSLPAVDGLADDRLKLLVNGMTLTSACPNHMNPALSYIDPAAVSRISVLAGITPASLGGDSIGGTIVVQSADPVFAAAGNSSNSGNITAFGRSNGRGVGGSVNLRTATDRYALTYTGATVHSGNYRDGDGHAVRSTEYESRNHLLSVARNLGGGFVQADLGWQDIPYQGFVNQFMDMTANRSNSINIRYAQQLGWGSIKAGAFRNRVRHSMNMLEDKAALGGNMPMETAATDSGYHVTAAVTLRNDEVLRIGHEYHRYTLDDWWPPVPMSMMMGPNAFWNIRDGRRERLVFFGELHDHWGATLTSQVGARIERVTSDAGDVQGYYSTGEMMMMGMPNGSIYQADASAFNARAHRRSDANLDITAALRYEPGPQAAYDFGIARKVRSPNLYERYAWSNEAMMAGAMISWFGDLNAYVGNLDLKPEVAYAARLHANWHDSEQRNWELQASPFYTRVHDYIDVEPNMAVTMMAPMGRVALRFVNHDARLYGVDISGSTLLGHAAGEWRASALLNYVRTADLDAGTGLYNTMPLNGSLSLTHARGAWQGTLQWQVVAAKDRLDTVRQELATPGYSLLNARGSYRVGRVRIDASIDNLLDRAYELPLGGLDVIRYTESGGDLAQVRGTGRSFNLGVAYSY